MPRSLFGAVVLAAALRPAFSQQIYDIWQTTWDRTNLFSNISPSTPINFVTPGAIGDADIVITDNTVYQQMVGFGGSLTDSSASILVGLKVCPLHGFETSDLETDLGLLCRERTTETTTRS